MATPVEVGSLPPFGVNNAIGAFTQEPYPGHLWLITGTNGNGTLHCYNILQRSFEDFQPTALVYPADSFVLIIMQDGAMKTFIGN